MDSKVTSFNRPRFRNCRGFTLVETMIGLLLGVLLATIVMAFAIYNGRSFAVLHNWMELHQANRITLDQMTRDIRQVNRMTTFATNSVTFEDADGKSLSFTFDPVKKTLTKSKNGVSTVLLRQCDSIIFSMMQRNIIEGSYDYYPADDVQTCKVVGVKWSCSRNILGKKAQLSEDQTTQVVIRKQ